MKKEKKDIINDYKQDIQYDLAIMSKEEKRILNAKALVDQTNKKIENLDMEISKKIENKEEDKFIIAKINFMEEMAKFLNFITFDVL